MQARGEMAMILQWTAAMINENQPNYFPCLYPNDLVKIKGMTPRPDSGEGKAV
jgi:hypothetical protein